jgi:alpha-galactosidase
MSHIDRDKVSLPEIWGHLKDHTNVSNRALLHWLYPGKDLINELRVLVDDTTCIEMADTIGEGGVAEIYVEAPYEAEHESPIEVTTLTQTKEQIAHDVEFVKAWYSPSKTLKQKSVVEVSGDNNQSEWLPHEEFSNSDSDYLPGDEAASEEDEEASEIYTKFKHFKSKLKGGEAASLDDVVLERPKEVSDMCEIEDDGNATSYEDSYGEEDSIEELSDGEVVIKRSTYPTYNKKDPSPKFEIGMKFSGKRQFKKAPSMDWWRGDSLGS